MVRRLGHRLYGSRVLPQRGGTVLTLAAAWNGTVWKVQPTPNPAGGMGSYLDGVSCTSATACTAVGDYAGTGVTLAERWNGTAWTIQPTRNPAGAFSSDLDGVSCTSATACTAVGDYFFKVNANSIGVGSLAERWNGTAWTIQSTPNPAGTTGSGLDGVSCTSATACTAVGYHDKLTTSSSVPVGTLAERWNGTAWTIQPTPNPGGPTDSQMEGVSCTSATACTAVGYYPDASGTVPLTLAERWNGTAWKVQPTPNPTGGNGYLILDGVSCTSATACTAVGFHPNATVVTLAVQWNGTVWKVQPTPNPAGAVSSQLSGVSCASATACTAVGSDAQASGTGATLAERYS